MQNTVDFVNFCFDISQVSKHYKHKIMWICGFMKKVKSKTKKSKELYTKHCGFVDFHAYFSKGPLILETLITQIDVDLWILFKHNSQRLKN